MRYTFQSTLIELTLPKDDNLVHGFSTEAQARSVAESLIANSIPAAIDGKLTISPDSPDRYTTSFKPSDGYFPFEIGWTEKIQDPNSSNHELKRFSVNVGNEFLHMIDNPAGKWNKAVSDSGASFG